MITGRDFVYISSIDWSFLWQSHQEIATRLAAAGNRVFYIENMGVRSPRLADASRVAARLRRWSASRRSKGVLEVSPNIYVCSPLVFPPFGSGWRRALNRRIFVPRLKRAARDLGFHDPIIWTYLPTDTCTDLIRCFGSAKSLVVYHCVADFQQLTPETEKLRASESDLLRICDIVLATCTQLEKNAGQLNENVYLTPHGVNLEAFPFEVAGPGLTQPTELVHLLRPIIGYVGGLHRHLDLPLVRQMALRKPDWHWVFVGSLDVPLQELDGLANVTLLGPRPHGELASYINSFDVCIVPYADTEATATVVPTKINEYLAMGKPVVCTDIPAVSEFNLQHRVISLSSTKPDDFLAAIEQNLESAGDRVQTARRREVAAAADWNLRLSSISEIIERHLVNKKSTPEKE